MARSKSGPVRIVGYVAPTPLSPEQQRLRLSAALADVESKIAAKLSWSARNNHRPSKGLHSLYERKTRILSQINALGEL